MDARSEPVRMQISQLLHAKYRNRRNSGFRLQIVEMPCPCGLSDETLVTSDQYGPLATVYNSHECAREQAAGPPSMAELDQEDEDSLRRDDLRTFYGARPRPWDEALPRAIAWSQIHPECGGFTSCRHYGFGQSDLHGSRPRSLRGCTLLPEVLSKGGRCR